MPHHPVVVSWESEISVAQQSRRAGRRIKLNRHATAYLLATYYDLLAGRAGYFVRCAEVAWRKLEWTPDSEVSSRRRPSRAPSFIQINTIRNRAVRLLVVAALPLVIPLEDSSHSTGMDVVFVVRRLRHWPGGQGPRPQL